MLLTFKVRLLSAACVSPPASRPPRLVDTHRVLSTFTGSPSTGGGGGSNEVQLPAASRAAREAGERERALAAAQKSGAKAGEQHMQLEFVYEMRAYLVYVLVAAGCSTKDVEGEGDCALISTMYGKEISTGDALGLPKTVRTTLTQRRKGVVEFMSTSIVDNPALFLTLSEVVNVGILASIAGVEKIDENSSKGARKALTSKIKQKLKAWTKAQHYGEHQQLFMAGFGWMLKRNILQVLPRRDCVRSEGVPHCLACCHAVEIACLRCDWLMVPVVELVSLVLVVHSWLRNHQLDEQRRPANIRPDGDGQSARQDTGGGVLRASVVVHARRHRTDRERRPPQSFGASEVDKL